MGCIRLGRDHPIAERTHLRQSIKNIVEEKKYLSFSDLGDVVHALASIVSDTRILVREARQNWRHYLFEVRCYSFLHSSDQSELTTPPLYPITH